MDQISGNVGPLTGISGLSPQAPVDPSNPTNARSGMEGGKAVFENDNYRISASDDNTVIINNKHTGEIYEAWGDTHMAVSGPASGDAWDNANPAAANYTAEEKQALQSGSADIGLLQKVSRDLGAYSDQMGQVLHNGPQGSMTPASLFGPTGLPVNGYAYTHGGMMIFPDGNTAPAAGYGPRDGSPNLGDGKSNFDFWGKTTLALDDGTKVTIDTTPAAGNPNATLASQVTITNGDYGVQISGIDGNRTGDLQIDEQPGHGRDLDARVDDGNLLHENRFGRGFVGIDAGGHAQAVDQALIDRTDPKRPTTGPGPAPKPAPAAHTGSPTPAAAAPATPQKGAQLQARHQDAFHRLSSLLSIAFQGMFLGDAGGQGGRDTSASAHRPAHRHSHGHRPHEARHDLPRPGTRSDSAVDTFAVRFELTMFRGNR